MNTEKLFSSISIFSMGGLTGNINFSIQLIIFGIKKHLIYLGTLQHYNEIVCKGEIKPSNLNSRLWDMLDPHQARDLEPGSERNQTYNNILIYTYVIYFSFSFPNELQKV